MEASQLYDDAREAVRKFINAAHGEEIVFVRNATEALNIVARSYGETHLRAGDKIVIPISEHHESGYLAACSQGYRAELVYMYLDETGHFTDADLAKIDNKTKIVAFAAVSNVLGMKTPIDKIIAKALLAGAAVLDGAQAAPPYAKCDVQKWDCDFFVFSVIRCWDQRVQACCMANGICSMIWNRSCWAAI